MQGLVKDPIESMRHFCIIQLELLKERKHKLRKEIHDCEIQKEFLTSVLEDLGEFISFEGDIVENLLNTNRRKKQ